MLFMIIGHFLLFVNIVGFLALLSVNASSAAIITIDGRGPYRPDRSEAG
jgi:hypothetical protein